MITKAICEFVLHRDVAKAHRLITRCRSDRDGLMWYSRAFLHAYQGKMDQAYTDYKRAFSAPHPDVTTLNECEEFIEIVLTEEPHLIQLHFCLGLLNFYGKQDYAAARSDMERFLKDSEEGQFEKQRKLASDIILETERRQPEDRQVSYASEPAGGEHQKS